MSFKPRMLFSSSGEPTRGVTVMLYLLLRRTLGRSGILHLPGIWRLPCSWSSSPTRSKLSWTSWSGKLIFRSNRWSQPVTRLVSRSPSSGDLCLGSCLWSREGRVADALGVQAGVP
jgi:hypothetical protein